MADGRRIRQLRREHCLTQAELGAKAGTGQYAISKAETGQIARPQFLPALAAFFGLRETDLLILPTSQHRPTGPSDGTGAAGRAGEDRLYWSVPQTAAVLGVSRQVVYRLVAAGELTARHAGRSWRITAASVRAHQASPDRQPAQPVPAGQQRRALLAIDRHQLRALRHERGWTQLELAHRAGLTISRISELETGHHTRTSAIPALARALAVPPAALQPPGHRHPATPAPGTARPAATPPATAPPAHAGGAWLRHLRHQRGLTQAALAHRAQISRSYLSSLEHGHRTRPDLIPSLAQALDLTPADLIPPAAKTPARPGAGTG